MARAVATTDHEKIKHWVEERGGHPARVRGTGADGDPGIIRIDFPGFSGARTLEEISWDEFLDAFDANKLAFLHQQEPDSRFNKLVSRETVKGRTKGKKAPAKKGGVDAIELLTEQHREVDELFEKLESAKTPSQKDRVFFRLADRLAAHSTIEETLFYPSVFTDGTEHLLRESVEEHLMMKRVLADLMEMEADDPQFMIKVILLKELVQRHVAEEENELFPKVQEEEVEDLQTLGARLKKRYRELIKSEPHNVIPEETERAVVNF